MTEDHQQQKIGEAITDSGPGRTGPKLIAPVWHTVLLVSALMLLSWLGARGRSFAPVVPHSSGRAHGHIFGYTTTIAIEWLLVAFVWCGLRLRRVRMADLMGYRGMDFLGVLRNLGIAFLFLFSSNLILAVLAILLQARNQVVRSIVPHSRAEIALYLLLALSAGICEEIVCRGYLQNQFGALARNAGAGIAIQGIIFGAAHGYQGIKFMFIIGVYGCLFGLLAGWRKSLVPGMMAHALQDGIVGLIARHAVG